MKPLFKNTTQYNSEVYKEFLNFHAKKFHLTFTIYNIFVIAFLLFCIIYQISKHNFSIAIFICFLLTGFILWRNLRPAKEVRETYESNVIQKEQKFTFSFYPKHLRISSMTQYQTIKYSKLYRIYETKTFFYLYIDRTHSYLLDKNKFLIGTPQKFKLFIKKKCPFKVR